MKYVAYDKNTNTFYPMRDHLHEAMLDFKRSNYEIIGIRDMPNGTLADPNRGLEIIIEYSA